MSGSGSSVSVPVPVPGALVVGEEGMDTDTGTDMMDMGRRVVD